MHLFIGKMSFVEIADLGTIPTVSFFAVFFYNFDINFWVKKNCRETTARQERKWSWRDEIKREKNSRRKEEESFCPFSKNGIQRQADRQTDRPSMHADRLAETKNKPVSSKKVKDMK